jgi:hypothetical protein
MPDEGKKGQEGQHAMSKSCAPVGAQPEGAAVDQHQRRAGRRLGQREAQEALARAELHVSAVARLLRGRAGRRP